MTKTTHEGTGSTWQDKAHRVIGSLCRTSYLQANTKANGERYKRHRPYSVPAVAKVLIDCLNTNDEETAKSIFIGQAFTENYGNV